MPKKSSFDFTIFDKYEWTGKSAAVTKEGKTKKYVKFDFFDYRARLSLDSKSLYLLDAFIAIHLSGSKGVAKHMQWGTKGGAMWEQCTLKLLNFGHIQAFQSSPIQSSPYCDAPPSESRCDSSSGVSDTQLKAANDSKRQRAKKQKKPVNEQRAKDSALVRKIFQGRYQSKFGMVYSEWGGRQIGQSHAFVNHLRQIFTDVDEITVEMVIVGYFSDKESWCGDSEPGSVKSIGFMSTAGNIQSSINIMKRVYGQARPEMDERELQYVERVAKIRDFSETGSREAANEQEDGDQGVQTKGSD